MPFSDILPPLIEVGLLARISSQYLSKETGIPVSTLRKYRQKDEYLFKASFINIYLLTQFFSVPETLFLETVPQIK